MPTGYVSRRARETADADVDWEWLTHLLMCRSGGRCECCGHRIRPDDRVRRHHRKLRIHGGPHVIENLLLLLDAHHRIRVHDQPTIAYACGWIVRRDAEPGRVPLLTFGGRRVTLDPSGLYVPYVPNEGATA